MWEELKEMFCSSTAEARVDGPVVMETLEGRQMMSASHALDWDAHYLPPAASATYALPAQSAPTLSAAKKAATLYPSCVGSFNGNYVINAQGGQGAMSAKFTKQKNGSVTGTFNFPLLGKAVTTTMNVGTDKTMRGNIKTGGNELSITASVSTDGKYVTGRWSLHRANGTWLTGAMTFSRP